jgi:hypothetical protein
MMECVSVKASRKFQTCGKWFKERLSLKWYRFLEIVQLPESTHPSFMIFRKNPKNALCKMETRKPSGKKKKRETPLLDH